VAKIEWGTPGEKELQFGVDHGVIYMNDGRAVPWNGLVSVTEKSDRTASPVYFDGHKVHDHVSTGSYGATIKAITYPDEILEVEGFGEIIQGAWVGEQRPTTFCMTYRTQLANDLEPTGSAYRIHVLYNVSLIAADKTYNTVGQLASPMTFEWSATTVPEESDFMGPGAHLFFDSNELTPAVLEWLELRLYGGDTANPDFPSYAELTEYLFSYYAVEIVDNNDGTWTANINGPGYLTMLTATSFQLDNVDAVTVDANTYVVSSTR
jgi:hypothetical protein